MALQLKVKAIFALVTLVTITSQQRAANGRYRSDYHIIPHAVDLGTITFDKVISHQNVTVVMFMHYLSSGPKQTEFAKFAESTVTQSEVIAATVGVIDDVDMNNWELAVRFGISMEQLPLIKLFVRGEEVTTMQTALTCENLRNLVTENTGLWLGRTGTLEYLDSLANAFMKTSSPQEKERVIDMARQFKAKNATEDDHIKSATYYIRIFEEYAKQGPTFLGIEAGRLKALMARHKLHEPNKCGIRKEQNILETFQRSYTHQSHDEL